MITEYLLDKDFEWAKKLPELFDSLLGLIYFLGVVPIGMLLDLLLMPIELFIILLKIRRNK